MRSRLLTGDLVGRLEVLGIVTMVTLPMMSLAVPRVGQVTWPVTDNIRHPGTPKNRKGLRHSPGVLMDVMRSPTTIKVISGPSWKYGDQLASHSGGHSHRWRHGERPPPSVPKTIVYIPAITNYIVTGTEPRRKPHSVYQENNVAASSVLQPWSVSADAPNLNFAPPAHLQQAAPSAWQVPPYVIEPDEMTAHPPEPDPPREYHPLPKPQEEEANLVKPEDDALGRYVPTGTDAPSSFQAPGTLRKTRAHVRIFSNAHQYKRDLESGATLVSPSVSPASHIAHGAAGASVKSDYVLEAIDETHQESPWFKALLGQVIAAAEISEKH